MGCYAIPAAAAILHFFMRKKSPSLRNNKHHLWLNQLFLGGAIFGVVDHLWHGELFMFKDKILLDLALGVTITVAITLTWVIIVLCNKTSKTTTKNIN